MTEQEKEIRALNQLLLEQKDHINALEEENKRLRSLLEKVKAIVRQLTGIKA